MTSRRFLSVVAALVVAGVATAGYADVLVLDLIPDAEGAGTWQVVAWLEGDEGGDPNSAGLSDFKMDVVGSGGATVTGSTNKSPSTAFWSVPKMTVITVGFAEIRQDGVNGVGIIGSQKAVYGEVGQNDPEFDKGVIQGVGITSGSLGPPDYMVETSWDHPALLASGTYSGAGYLTVSSDPSICLLLKDTTPGGSWHGPGHTYNPSAVQGDTEAVPSGVVNQDPNADADGPYEEGDWQEEPADPEVNFIILDGTGSSDPDGDPLTFEWDLTVDPLKPLVVTGAQPKVLAQTLVDHGYDSYVDYEITLTVDDGNGGTDTDTTTLMVPEPGTLALLGLGVVGVLLRRRRG